MGIATPSNQVTQNLAALVGGGFTDMCSSKPRMDSLRCVGCGYNSSRRVVVLSNK